MFDLYHLMIFAVLGLGAYYAVGAIKLKEAALRAVEHRCQQSGVQLLDGTIFLRRFGLARRPNGHLAFKKEFQFEFTATGEDRNRGWVLMYGKRVAAIDLAPHKFQ